MYAWAFPSPQNRAGLLTSRDQTIILTNLISNLGDEPDHLTNPGIPSFRRYEQPVKSMLIMVFNVIRL